MSMSDALENKNGSKIVVSFSYRRFYLEGRKKALTNKWILSSCISTNCNRKKWISAVETIFYAIFEAETNKLIDKHVGRGCLIWLWLFESLKYKGETSLETNAALLSL